MTTGYPGAIDDLDEGTRPGLTHGDVADSVEAIQATLGVNPQGSETTVAARLAALSGGVTSVNGDTGAVIVERFRGAWATDTLVYTQNFADAGLPTGFSGSSTWPSPVEHPTVGSSAGPTGVPPAPAAAKMVCNSSSSADYSRLTLNIAALNISGVTRIKYWHAATSSANAQLVTARTLVNSSVIHDNPGVMAWTQREHLVDSNDVVAWQSQGYGDGSTANLTLFVTGIEIYAAQTEPYMRGDVVVHANTLWQSTVDNNGAIPGGAGWTDLGPFKAAPTVTSLPTASADLRGQFRLLEAASVDDGLRVCVRLADGTYAWRTVTLTA